MLIVIYFVEAGFLALARLTLPPALVSAGNNPVNLTNSEIFPLLAGTLNVHVLLQIAVTFVVLKFD